MQLSDMAQWKISYANAEGSGAKLTTYSIRSQRLYVCQPNYDSVDKISKKIKKFMKQTPEDTKKDEKNSGGGIQETTQPTLEP